MYLVRNKSLYSSYFVQLSPDKISFDQAGFEELKFEGIDSNRLSAQLNKDEQEMLKFNLVSLSFSLPFDLVMMSSSLFSHRTPPFKGSPLRVLPPSMTTLLTLLENIL